MDSPSEMIERVIKYCANHGMKEMEIQDIGKKNDRFIRIKTLDNFECLAYVSKLSKI